MGYRKIELPDKRIRLFEIIDGFSAADLNAVAGDARTALDGDGISFFVLDLGSHRLAFELLRPLTLLGSELKSKGKKLCVLSEGRSVVNLISSEGLTGVIVPIMNLAELKPGGGGNGAAKGAIDVDFINPFLEGVMHVLKVQCSLDCRPGRPYLKDAENGVDKVDIAGVIGVANPKFMGTISVCFSERAFLLIMSKMFGEEYGEITKDLEDGAGEILNMVFGHAKRVLNERGYGLEKALPTVVRGSGVVLNHLSAQNTIVLPFTAGDLGFHMEICTEKK